MPARLRLIAIVATIWVALAPAGWAAESPGPSGAPRPISIRIRWGGGAPRAWSGRIDLVGPATAAGPIAFSWKTLGTEPDAAATAHEELGTILLHQPRPLATDGIEVTVVDWRQAQLSVQIEPVATGETAVSLDLPLSTVLAGPVHRPLDSDGNRLTVETAPGDALQATLLPAAAGDRRGDTAIRRPGEVVRFQVAPLLSIKPGEGEFELRIRLSGPGEEKPILAQTARLVPLATVPPAATVASGRIPTDFEQVDFQFPLPSTEGVYEVALEAVERGGLRWTRPLATRTLQVVALADATTPPPAAADWAVVYELDPGSPKLHERLRRLPGRGLPGVSVPDIALPTMPLPSLSRAQLPLPRLPEMTGLPEVPLPNVAAMVPRLSGLLATGHSVVVPHGLGPMLRLPPAPRPSEPTWEAIVVAGAQPGRPHLVEIDHPQLHRAIVVACVLESDATGTASEVRHAGGFEVTPPADAGPDRLGTHRFVFWPTTRNPLVVIANPSGAGPALVGRVRILAGPERLPPAARPAPNPLAATRGRSTFAVFTAPDLHRRHGGAGQVAATGGLPFADWSTHLAGIRHSAEMLLAGGLSGGVIPVYADGAAIWPSRLTRQAARWDAGATGDAGLDPQPKDLLGAVAMLYGRERLALIPAFTFNAAIPALEAELVGATPAGIACVGADGRPRRLAGGVHYNILDPRVQAAVEQVIAEAGERLAGEPAVAGLALVLPHDGWLHLPGLTWGLDDATFGRFSETVGAGQAATGPERFAERARLVDGPLREAWLAWRGGVVGDFYARLTARVAAIDSRWPVYLVPTTLAAAGDFADRFRPSLEDRREPTDLLREFGLVTGLPPAGGGRGLVFMAPHVHAPGAGLRERSTVADAGQALALADVTRAGDRRGAVIASRPLPVDLSAVVPHGPFATATPPGPCGFTVVTDDDAGDRGLAMALVASDAEVVFDMRAAVSLPRQPSAARRSFESLPADGMQLVTGLPAPLAVRTVAAGGTTRIAVVNAGPAAAQAVLALAGSVSAAIDATDGAALPLDSGPVVSVPLPAWGVRSLVIDGGGRVDMVRVVHDDAVRDAVAGRIDRLRQRLAVLEAPSTLDVLDNPGFELGLGQPAAGDATITGWELVEPRRGALELVAGLRQGDRQAAAARGLSFTSRNGLSTLRSNPFPPPATGRISVAAWLRIAVGDPQPPLRIAIEAVEAGREYYRFASVGGLAGGRPLSSEWSLFVLQVDDLPSHAIESLRVRFDLLGPGGVQIDDVRVCDLAFDAAQRGRLAGRIAALSHHFGQGDVGAALVGLDGHWPEFLETFVDDAKLAAVSRRPPEPQPSEQPAAARQGMMDRLRGWWQ